MSIVRMKRLRLLGMRSDREDLLRVLQKLGCVEISEPTIDLADPNWAALAKPEGRDLSSAKEQESLLSNALTILNKYAPAKGGLLQARPELSERDFFDDQAYQAGLEAAQAIVDAERSLAVHVSEQGKLQNQKASLAPWLPLDVPLEYSGGDTFSVIFGTVPARANFAAVEAAVAEATDLFQLFYSGADRELSYFLLVCYSGVESECLEAMRPFGYSQANLRGWTGTAADNDRQLNNQLAVLAERIEADKAQIASFADRRLALQQALDRCAQEVSRAEAKGRLIDTENAFYLDGWLPVADVEKLDGVLSRYTCAWETSDPVEEEYPAVPVKLKNGVFSRCMNVVTEMYSLPAYDGVDPNPLMAPFFIVFFGVMMADMAYGILMVAAALVVLLKTRPREGTRNFMELVFWCGVSTFVVGAMTGGFLGDFIPQFIKLFNPNSTFEWFWPPLFTPLNNTVEILVGSLVLGVIQVFTGMGISVVKKVKDGEFIDALFDEITWWIIIAGGVLAIFNIGSIAGVPVVLVIGVLMLVFGGTRKAKGFGKVASLVGLVYNGVTGYFSDILSYMRLMALMLSGSVIAQVFNTLASVVGGMVPVVGVVLFIVISLVGNMLNLALNLLGCYVHDLRLQCLEYFNRFYKEGGKPFKPLVVNTKYVDIMKEEN